MGLLQQLKEISRAAEAGKTVEHVQQRKLFQVAVVTGDWRLADSVKRNGVFNAEDFNTIQQMKTALLNLSNSAEYSFIFIDNHSTIMRDLKVNKPDLVLNLCDEGYLNDALMELHVPALMEMFRIPYTGAGPTSLGMCYDKSLVRALAISVAVPVPDEMIVNLRMGEKVPVIKSFPRFIKPSLGDNSVGITPGSLVRTQEEAENYVSQLYQMLPDRASLIQEYLEGTEYSVGLIGNPLHGFTRLPILEVDYSKLDPSLPPILGYESKFEPDSPYWTDINYKQAGLSPSVADELYKCAERLFERCWCRDYARFDFRADSNGVIKLLEVNPNPGWCWDGKLNKMAGLLGWNYSQMLEGIITAARKRVNC